MIRMMVSALFMLIFSTCLFAQANDSIDVSALVKKQILLAQQKEKNNTKVVPVKSTIVSKPEFQNDIENSGMSTASIIKIIILLCAILIASAVIGKRRYKMRKIENRIKLKQNVKQLREEQLVKNIDPRLKMIRKKLCLNSSYLNKPEKEVILAARKLSIAKEEILLASRLNSYGIGQKMGATAQ